MSAPTSGTGYGEYRVEIGAALSCGGERPRSYIGPCLNQINTLRSGHLRFYAAFRALRDGRHRNANQSSIACHAFKAVWPWRGGSGNNDEQNQCCVSAGTGASARAGHSSNLACGGNRLWPSPHCCLDVSLRIWACQNNRDGILTNCKSSALKRAAVRNPSQLPSLAKPTKRPRALTELELQEFRPRRPTSLFAPSPQWDRSFNLRLMAG